MSSQRSPAAKDEIDQRSLKRANSQRPLPLPAFWSTLQQSSVASVVSMSVYVPRNAPSGNPDERPWAVPILARTPEKSGAPTRRSPQAKLLRNTF
eukprot:5009673-Amphidinium_carterae.1